jgi:hypothetical protein
MAFFGQRSPIFNHNFDALTSVEQKAIIKAVKNLLHNPRHPSLQTHLVEPRSRKPKIFEAYASEELRMTWQYFGEETIQAECSFSG